MSESYYKGVGKTGIFAEPHKYAWNCVLYFHQLTPEELLQFKSYVDIQSLVKYQTCATYAFVETHFSEMVDEDDLLSWDAVKKYTQGRDGSGSSK
jgi:hypothetical protein